jgi:hypothetical protein
MHQASSQLAAALYWLEATDHAWIGFDSCCNTMLGNTLLGPCLAKPCLAKPAKTLLGGTHHCLGKVGFQDLKGASRKVNDKWCKLEDG